MKIQLVVMLFLSCPTLFVSTHDFNATAIDTPVSSIVFLEAPHFVQSGSMRYVVKLPIFDRCRHLREFASPNSSSPHNVTSNLLTNTFQICEQLVASKYNPVLERIRQMKPAHRNRFPRDINESQSDEPKEIFYTSEKIDDWGSTSRGFFKVLSLFGLPETMEETNSKSSLNRVPILDEKVREAIGVINEHTKQITITNKSTRLLKQALETLLAQFNGDSRDLRSLVNSHSVLTQLIAKMNTEIQRDTDDLKSIENGLKRNVLDTNTIVNVLGSQHSNLFVSQYMPLNNFWVTSKAIHFEFQSPTRSEFYQIYKIESFREWISPYEYKEYSGPRYILHSSNGKCSKFIKDPSSLYIRDYCMNSTIDFNKPEFWRTNKRASDLVEKPQILSVDGQELIQCYPYIIDIMKDLHFACPMNVFSLPIEVNYTIDGHNYVYSKHELEAENEILTSFKLPIDNSTDPWQKNYENTLKQLKAVDANLVKMDESFSRQKSWTSLDPNVNPLLSDYWWVITLVFFVIIVSVIIYFYYRSTTKSGSNSSPSASNSSTVVTVVNTMRVPSRPGYLDPRIERWAQWPYPRAQVDDDYEHYAFPGLTQPLPASIEPRLYPTLPPSSLHSLE